jgi:hypothetical protein
VVVELLYVELRAIWWGAQDGGVRSSLVEHVIMLSAELMRDRIASLKRANEAASKRKQRKKKRIQQQGVLTKRAGEDIIAQREANEQITREERQGREQSGLSRQALARCSRCREPRHNARTCKKDSVDTA